MHCNNRLMRYFQSSHLLSFLLSLVFPFSLHGFLCPVLFSPLPPSSVFFLSFFFSLFVKKLGHLSYRVFPHLVWGMASESLFVMFLSLFSMTAKALIAFLLAGMTRCSRLILYFFCPGPPASLFTLSLLPGNNWERSSL